MTTREGHWRKSSRSGNSGQCVEVAGLSGNGIGIRDTKNREGGHLTVSAEEWRGFLAAFAAR